MLLSWLGDADKNLFKLINGSAGTPALDQPMLLMREAFTWVPVYLFFCLFFFFNCRKYFGPIVIITLVTFTLTDFVSASVLKPFIGRLRPCQDPSINFQINNIAGCGGLFSMPSSHASNHFGLSTLWFLIIDRLLNRRWYILFIWALLVGFSQIYVGVHFPGDIIVGALFGTAVGIFTFRLFLKLTHKISLATE